MSVSPGRVSVYGFGTLGLAAFVFKMLAVDYPDGDPARSRQAGDVWARLADRLEKNPDTTYPFAEAVWKKNGGDSVEAFKEAMISKLYPRPPETSFPDRLALACRRNSQACYEYAEIIETAQHAYWTAAWANFASFVFLTTFPWQAGAAGQLTQFLIRRAQAKLLAKLLEHATAKIVLSKLTEYTIGSTFFAVGDVATVAGVRALRGENPGSLGDNGTKALKEFAASIAFYGVSDAATPAIKAVTRNAELQSFLGRMAGGSIGYGPSYDALNGQSHAELIPTWKETLGRALLYFTMAHKPAG
ncbi:hypothetical protein [Streptosporangium lutulentum]|uniref:Outer membrane channel protein CpnT-like N-terminal domain-containing protein n=1 Tax=Streptosporangium lutulentum TaxID=1461250 RepID=A0ABT9QIV7_9ACTN|nr:hypothetical protein [Streptosporangium lutulentum]MDP9845889.1 hypothetical protein [Streptosporangium lutulentum]